MKLKSILILVSFAFILSGFFMFTWLFVDAYFSPLHKVTIDVNMFHEAHLEFLLLVFTIIALPNVLKYFTDLLRFKDENKITN